MPLACLWQPFLPPKCQTSLARRLRFAPDQRPRWRNLLEIYSTIGRLAQPVRKLGQGNLPLPTSSSATVFKSFSSNAFHFTVRGLEGGVQDAGCDRGVLKKNGCAKWSKAASAARRMDVEAPMDLSTSVKSLCFQCK